MFVVIIYLGLAKLNKYLLCVRKILLYCRFELCWSLSLSVDKAL